MSANKSNIFLNIITDYQNAGVQKAQSSLTSFESLAKKAAATFAGVFSAKAILDFGKASVAAFESDQKALALLDQTLVNIGEGFKSMQVNDFVKNLSLATGITKDQLIPAMQTLSVYTGDATKAQDLLKLSTDVAAGTGKDLATVSTAVAKAYGGQYTALSKLGVGLTTAQLKAQSFAKTQKFLLQIYGGDAAVAANTYAGKVARLSSAFDEMKVTIGQGLVDAFTNLAGNNGSIDSAITKIETFGYFVNGWTQNATTFFQGVETFFGNIAGNPVLQWIINHLPKLRESIDTLKGGVSATIDEGKLASYEAKLRANQALLEQTYKQGLIQKQIDDAAAVAKAKQLALDKASLQLKQASKVFDNQAAEIWAANAQAKDQSDKARLKLMQDQMDLQTAIDNKDSVLATKLAATVQQDVANVKSMQASIDSIKSSDNPLQSLQDALDQGLKTLDEMVAAYQQLTAPITPNSALAVQAAAVGTSVPAYAYNSIASGQSPTYAGSSLADMPAPVVNVQLDGQALAANVSQWLQDISASGSSTATLSRNNNPVINP